MPWHERSAISIDDDESAGAQPQPLPKICNGFHCLSALELLRLAGNLLADRNSLANCVLRFTGRQLAAIKNAAGRQGTVSLNDAMSAHLWQVCTKLQNAAHPTAPRTLLFGAGMQSIIDGPRARHYFGNVVSNVGVVCSDGELSAGDIAAIAGRCRQGVAALNRDYFRTQMRWLQAREKNNQMLRLFADVNPFAGDFAIGSQFKLPVYGACFDGNSPCWAGVPAVFIPGVMYLLPSPAEEDGGIDVYANLPRSAADRLQRDEWQSGLYRYGEAGDSPAGSTPPDEQECA